MIDPKEMKHEPNHDPVTGAGEFHPAGTAGGAVVGGALGVGAAAAAGAAMGAVGGPVGLVVGAAIGAVAGGLAGKSAAERLDPTVEDEYWRSSHGSQPYAVNGPYEDYAGAYRTGYEGPARYEGRNFDDVEADLQKDYERNRGNSTQDWTSSREAARASWMRAANPDRGN